MTHQTIEPRLFYTVVDGQVVHAETVGAPLVCDDEGTLCGTRRASLIVDGWPEWKRNLCRLERELVK